MPPCFVNGLSPLIVDTMVDIDHCPLTEIKGLLAALTKEVTMPFAQSPIRSPTADRRDGAEIMIETHRCPDICN